MSETRPDSESEKKAIPPNQDEPTRVTSEPNVADQIKAVLVLIPVLGVLWLTIQYLPKAGNWIGDQTDRLLGAEDISTPLNPENETEWKTSQGEAAAPSISEKEKPELSRADFRAQIVEQLGGSERAEVRYLAFSDDSTEIVVSLKVADSEGEEDLIEVFFERDKFGRYLSTEDSPLDSQITLWVD